MKKCLSLFLLLITIHSYGQLPSDFDFETNSNPDTKNELSIYFKSIITKKLLKEVKSSNKIDNITLSFNFNKEKEVYNVKTNSYNSELKKIIISGFQNYPIEKLNISEINTYNNYTLQIISKSKNKHIINCSSFVVIDTQPTCNNCDDLNNYYDLKTCFKREIEKHFYENFNFELVKNKDLEKDNHFIFNFQVRKNGDLIVKKDQKNKTKDWSILFKSELNRILNTFPKDFTPGTINSKASNSNYTFSLFTKKNEIPKFKKPYFQFDKYTQPNKNSEISKFFASNISDKLLKKADLNRINDRLLIYFNLDKNNLPINPRTNCRSKEIENLILSIFKSYPNSKLPFQSKSLLNSYTLQVLSFEDNETIVNCSSTISFERVPIFNGCENSVNIVESKTCLNKKLQIHVAKKFNTDNIDYTNLSGKVKIYCQFKFTKTGGVSILNIKAPNPSLKLEAYRTINSIPRLKMPGVQNGKPVNVTYMLPISFTVEKPRTKISQHGSNESDF